jgi:hypothetical protein
LTRRNKKCEKKLYLTNQIDTERARGCNAAVVTGKGRGGRGGKGEGVHCAYLFLANFVMVERANVIECLVQNYDS